MSSGSQDPFESVLFITRDVWLNAMLVQTLGTGIYTVIFFNAVATMLNRPKFYQRHRWLIAALTGIYLLIILILALEWFIVRQMFIIFGDTSEDTVNYFFTLPLWADMLGSTAVYTSMLIADAILLWRCLVLWDRNWYVKSLPIASYTAEFGMAIYGLWGEAVTVKTGNALGNPGNIYLGLSLSTTVICTLLIAYRILRMGIFTPASPYRSIIAILCESAALYSVALIIFIPMYVSQNVTVNYNSEYMKRVMICITGIAPTIMTARIAGGVENPTEVFAFKSTLQFGDSSDATRASFNQSSSGVLGQFKVASRSIAEDSSV